jgi:hypothetical protein
VSVFVQYAAATRVAWPQAPTARNPVLPPNPISLRMAVM